MACSCLINSLPPPQPLPVSALRNPKFEAIYASTLSSFNAIQTQVPHT